MIAIGGLLSTIKSNPGISTKELKELYPEDSLQSILKDLVAIGELVAVAVGEEYYIFIGEAKIYSRRSSVKIGIYESKFRIVVDDGSSDIWYSGLLYAEAREQFEENKKKGIKTSLVAGICGEIVLDSTEGL